MNFKYFLMLVKGKHAIQDLMTDHSLSQSFCPKF